MTILRQTVYASAPTGETLIPSLEILVPGNPIRICHGFEDHFLGIDGQYHLFEAGSLSVALPARNTTGQQNLMFGIANVNGLVQRYVDAALESGEEVPIIYREYLASDKSAPMSRPLRMIMRGADEYKIIADIPKPWPVVTLKHEPPHVYFGTAERWTFPALVTEIRPGDGKARVTAVNYDARIYLDDQNTPPAA